MAEKVTTMVIKVVDLQCSCYYDKIKKILCKISEIRDQVYDEKANTVTIKVVCSDPEKIKDKLWCKGRKVIISIEIKEPEKPKPPTPTETPNPKKPNDPEKSENQNVVVKVVIDQKPEPIGLPPVEKEDPKKNPTCCSQCDGGHKCWRCQRGCGVPPPPRPCFIGYYDGCQCGCGRRRDCPSFSRCGYCLSDENPSSCSVM